MNGYGRLAEIFVEALPSLLAYLYFIGYLIFMFLMGGTFVLAYGGNGLWHAISIGCGLGFSYYRCRKLDFFLPLAAAMLLAYGYLIFMVISFCLSRRS